MGSPTKDLRPPAPPPMHHLEPALTIANEQRQSTPPPADPAVGGKGGRGRGRSLGARGSGGPRIFAPAPRRIFFGAPLLTKISKVMN